MYILEAQKFTPYGFKHLGYVNKIFKSKKNACIFYDQANPWLRPINAYNTYTSDWHPKNNLRFVVRHFDREILTLDESIVIEPNLHGES